MTSAPTCFEAWEEIAAYVTADLSRARAITEARDLSWQLAEHRREDLRCVRVWMRPIDGEEALEFFDGEIDSGYAEVTTRPLNAAQRANLVPMWRVEPR